MSSMEEDSIRFLKKVAFSILIGLIWLFINIGVSMYNDWVVPQNGLEWKHILFYVWAILSTLFMIRQLLNTWKNK